MSILQRSMNYIGRLKEKASLMKILKRANLGGIGLRN